MESIYIIEKGWIDYLENNPQSATGYEPCGFVLTEEEAKQICNKSGSWTEFDCWAIAVYYSGNMPKMRYRELKRMEE
jgi:hypothetical protein